MHSISSNWTIKIIWRWSINHKYHNSLPFRASNYAAFQRHRLISLRSDHFRYNVIMVLYPIKFTNFFRPSNCRNGSIDAESEWRTFQSFYFHRPNESVRYAYTFHITAYTISMNTSFVHPQEVYNLTKCISRMYFRQTNGRLNYKSNVRSFQMDFLHLQKTLLATMHLYFLPNNESNDHIIPHPSKSQWMWVHFSLMHGPPLCSLSIHVMRN